jgi:hypothetical protein
MGRRIKEITGPMGLISSNNKIEINASSKYKVTKIYSYIKIKWNSKRRLESASLFYRTNAMCFFSENGLILFLWFGQHVSPEFMTTVFGVASPQQFDLDKVKNLYQL